MVVEPRVKDYICTTAHPVGCAENIKNQIKYVKAQLSSITEPPPDLPLSRCINDCQQYHLPSSL